MKPSLSIIFFTVSSGAGLGLLALLALADLGSLGLVSDRSLLGGLALALVLVVAGLASSTLHLAKPSNAWRAFSRFRTSWLSREAVFSALLMPTVLAYAATIWFGAATTRSVLAILVVVLSWVVLFCTAMIYASLKPIRQWHTRWTPVNYVLLGHWSAVVILLAFATVVGAPRLMSVAVLLGALALVAKLVYWHSIADATLAPTIERAIGVREGVHPPGISVAQARLFDVGHSHRTFLTDEFVFRVARKHTSMLRIAAVVLTFAVPALWLWMGPINAAVALAVAILCMIGLLAERWLFFAEARHTVRLYHGDARA
jgi:sulfite dehydrogenase (quinone) subunit SoeC